MNSAVDKTHTPPAEAADNTDIIETAIIGAGFGGIGLAIRMQQQGLQDFLIFEKAGDVGGVWRDNIYPGAACDVPSHLYSFSFEPNPDWGRRFSPQQEIYSYLQYCARKHNLKDKLCYGHELNSMRFDEERGLWIIEFTEGRRQLARSVVMAIGALNIPQYPNIKGLQDFKGRLMHTAEWDAEFKPNGKRIAVIGTGASAIQAIPELQKTADSLAVFQRTPPWVMPKFDKKIKPSEARRFRRFPFLQRLSRGVQYSIAESVVLGFLWDSFLTRIFEKVGRSHLRKVIKDPVLREKLTPSYSMGCKRVLLSDDYYPALQKPNVSLIDSGISHIDETGVVDANGQHHELDAIVLATGFKVPVAGSPMPVYGMAGRNLNDDWAEGSEAYKGMTVSGYPNMLYMMGPNTGPGNTSVIYYIESQIHYALKYLKRLRRQPEHYLDLRKDVQRRFNDDLQAKMEGTTWTSGCNSWYLTPSGKNTTLWPSFSWRYRLMTKKFTFADYYAFKVEPDQLETSDEQVLAS